MINHLVLLTFALLWGAAARASGDELERSLQARAAGALGVAAEDVEVLLASTPNFARPLVEYDLRFTAIPRGRVVVQASAPSAPSLSFVADVRVKGDVPVAARRIDRGTELQPDMFVTARRDITDCSPLRLDEVSGQRSRRVIVPGAVLTTDLAEPVPLIDRGSPVTVVAQQGAVRVSRSGVALSDARLGEPLRVRLDRRTVIATIVTGRGLCTAGS
jgi:flagella basal body P-ring formation protein FlgA